MRSTTQPALTTASGIKLPATLRRIVLTGFMGAGKTTIGRRLAAALNWEFLDIDDFIEQRDGRRIAEIFAAEGEPHFRRFESTCLAAALGHNNTVIALGGGTPEGITNRLLLEQTPGTHTIFLDAPFPVLFDRCMFQQHNQDNKTSMLPNPVRPVLADPAQAEARYHQRKPFYRRLAKTTIDTTTHETADTIHAILQDLSQRFPG